MIIREVICKRWFLRKWVKGIVLYPFIFYQGKPDMTLRKHEWVHIEQIQRLGVIKFYVTYLLYSFRLGYENNPYEIEAYRRESE